MGGVAEGVGGVVGGLLGLGAGAGFLGFHTAKWGAAQVAKVNMDRNLKKIHTLQNGYSLLKLRTEKQVLADVQKLHQLHQDFMSVKAVSMESRELTVSTHKEKMVKAFLDLNQRFKDLKRVQDERLAEINLLLQDPKSQGNNLIELYQREFVLLNQMERYFDTNLAQIVKFIQNGRLISNEELDAFDNYFQKLHSSIKSNFEAFLASSKVTDESVLQLIKVEEIHSQKLAELAEKERQNLQNVQKLEQDERDASVAAKKIAQDAQNMDAELQKLNSENQSTDQYARAMKKSSEDLSKETKTLLSDISKIRDDLQKFFETNKGSPAYNQLYAGYQQIVIDVRKMEQASAAVFSDVEVLLKGNLNAEQVGRLHFYNQFFTSASQDLNHKLSELYKIYESASNPDIAQELAKAA